MDASPPDIRAFLDQLDAVSHDADALAAGLSEAAGTWRAEAGSWTVAECLDHLAITNRVYLDSMEEPARRAREQGRLRRHPAVPGIVGHWFARSLEPPVRAPLKMKAPRQIVPREGPSFADAFSRFRAAHDDVGKFLHSSADLD